MEYFDWLWVFGTTFRDSVHLNEDLHAVVQLIGVFIASLYLMNIYIKNSRLIISGKSIWLSYFKPTFLLMIHRIFEKMI